MRRRTPRAGTFGSERVQKAPRRSKIVLIDISLKEGIPMKEPGLDGRHRDQSPPKKGEIQQKRSDTLNKNLPKQIPEFRADATLGTMRKVTGKVSEEAVRRAAKRLRP
jgi:hypothetical protein